MDNRKWESGASANPPAAPAAPSSGHPTDGDPLASVPPTIPGAYWFYQLGEELRAILTAAGITPDKANLTQLLTALRSAGVFTTPAQFDTSTKVASTEFVKSVGKSFAGLVQFTAAVTLTAGHAGKIVILASAGGFGVTLPAANAFSNGATVTIVNDSSSACTILRAGTNVIFPNGTGSILSFSLNSGDSITLVSDGVLSWYTTDGSGVLAYSSSFSSSLAASGYQKLPGGLIIQWGSGVTSVNTAVVTFPITFPNACRGVYVTPTFGGTAHYADTDGNITASGVTIRADIAITNFLYFAIGY